MTFSGLLGADVREVKVSLKQRTIQKGNNRVFFPSEGEAPAEEALEVLLGQERMLKDYLGIPAGRCAVAITQKVPEDARYVIDSAPGGWWVWVLKLNDITELSHADEIDSLYHTVMHERTEHVLTGSLARGKGLYEFNRRTRWIADGLADLLGYRFARGHSPVAALHFLAGRREAVKEAADDWHWRSYRLWDFLAVQGGLSEVKKQVSLMKRYARLLAGSYAMSFYYWASLERDKGPEVIKTIVAELRRSGRPTDENVQAIVRKLAGQKYVDRIDSLPAAEALSFFEAEIRALIPEVRAELKSPNRSVRMACYETLSRIEGGVFAVDLSGVPTTVIVRDAMPGSPAHEGGLRRADIVESLDGKAIESFDAFIASCEGLGQQSMTLQVRRNGTKQVPLSVRSLAGCKLDRIAK